MENKNNIVLVVTNVIYKIIKYLFIMFWVILYFIWKVLTGLAED